MIVLLSLAATTAHAQVRVAVRVGGPIRPVPLVRAVVVRPALVRPVVVVRPRPVIAPRVVVVRPVRRVVVY